MALKGLKKEGASPQKAGSFFIVLPEARLHTPGGHALAKGRLFLQPAL